MPTTFRPTPNPIRAAAGSALEWSQKPLMPAGAIKGLQGAMDVERPVPPQGEEGGYMDAFRAIPDVARGMWNNPRETMGGFGAGALEGARQQTSPLGLANIAATGYGAASALGARGAASAAKMAPRALQGLQKAISGEGQAMNMVDDAAAGARMGGRRATDAAGSGPINWGPGKMQSAFAQEAGGVSDAAQGLKTQEMLAEMRKPTAGLVDKYFPEAAAKAGAAVRQPKVGGTLYDVLEQGGLKQGTGMGNTPGELALMQKFGKAGIR